ncbi:MAG: GNAT family N-acetyltransferase [Proteobacteria bacterium]|nr:GNAT family N-acetyltransferase [Pseudomonadota bacterium]
MLELEIQPFDLSKENDLLQFIESHPWKPQWSEGYVKEFIRLLISAPDLIFELYSKHQRIAAAVLIDQVQNRGNNALLEFLGLDKHYSVGQIYTLGIQLAKNRLPKYRSGIEVTVHESLHEVDTLLLEQEFTPYYEFLEMSCNIDIAHSNNKSNNIYQLTEEDYTEFYEDMVESFTQNIEIWTPNYEDGKLLLQDCQTWVYKEDGKIVGFLIIADIKNKTGEIRAIGVLPHLRSKRIGIKLLSFSLGYFAKMGIATCFSYVVNKKNIKMLQKLGFTVVDSYTVYCWKN